MTRRQRRGRNRESLQVLTRKIDATHSGIFFHVTQNVGELESNTAFFRQRFGGRIAVSEDVNAHQAYYRGHVITILVKLFESLVGREWRLFARLEWILQIHCSSLRQLVEQLRRDLKTPLRIGKSNQHGVVSRFSAKGTARLLRPRLQLRVPLLRGQQSIIADV